MTNSRKKESELARYALLGVIGLALFAWLFYRYSPTRHYAVTLDRNAAIARAQVIAQELGWPVNGFDVRVWSTDATGQSRYYAAHEPHPALAALLTPVRFNVHFQAPAQRQLIQVRMTGSGQLLRFSGPFSAGEDEGRRRGGPPPFSGPRPNAPVAKPAQATPENLQLAEQTLARYFSAASFDGPPTVTNTRQGYDFVWKKTLPEDRRLTLEAAVEIAQDRVYSLELTPQFSQALQAEVARADEGQLESALTMGLVLLVLLILLAMIFVFFDNLGRNEIQQRPALRLFFGSFLLLLAFSLLSGYRDTVNIGVNVPNRTITIFARLLVFSLLIALLALLLYLFWAAGHPLAARRAGRRTIAFELLLEGRFKHSYVARQILLGLCSASFVILPPYLLKATLFRAASFGTFDAFALFGAQSPFLMAFTDLIAIVVFTAFAFVVPLLETYVSRRSWVLALCLALGGLGLKDSGHFPYQPSAQFITGCLTAAFLYWLYQRHDLLAVITAAISGYVVWHAALLLVQPVPSLRWNGLLVLVALCVAALVAAVGVKHGAALDEKLFEPLHTAITAIERERLKAEIAVAQRAQQQMLPAAPPNIHGLEIAASCQPSQDVGGDLFDFLPLPDGRFGIVVADVSGKGVPAALYMTLTKGVLAAITEHESDPGAILREANRHLYEVCRKKVFVTLFLGVYDPATRVLTYARAGHNPTVYRSRTHNKTELLRPRGMGLGLSGEKLFNPTLAVASLQLTTDDLLFFYSDGITEAMNHQQEEYGEERLMAVAQRNGVQDARTAHDAVLADVKNFLGSVAPQDDQTLVVLRVLAHQHSA